MSGWGIGNSSAVGVFFFLFIFFCLCACVRACARLPMWSHSLLRTASSAWRARVVEASKAVADAYFPQLWGDMGAAGWSRTVMHFVLEDTRCDW